MNLKKLRTSKGLLQKEVAMLMGVTQRQYQRYEDGDSRLSTDRMTTLARALKVDIDTLFDSIQETHESPKVKRRRKKKKKKPVEIVDRKSEFVNYTPSEEGAQVHASTALWRFVVWGIKGGKTSLGAQETAKYALNNPNKLVWVVAYTYNNLEACEYELDEILYSIDGCVKKKNHTKHRYTLSNGTIIHIKSAKHHDTLRGPNVDFMWIDEADFMEDPAWYICKARTAARNGRIIATTTPNPNRRGWIWQEVRLGGMPIDGPYGIFESTDKEGELDNKRWVSHFPTWQFSWVPKEFIEDVKGSIPKTMFDTEYGAMFTDSDSSVFRYVEEAMGRYPILKKDDVKYVIGGDLAKHQDFTAIVVMDGSGHVVWVDRWTGVDWKIQKARIVALSQEWKAIVVLDVSNVGSVIEEDLRGDGVRIHPVDMNSPQVKTDLIQCLQVAFEKKNIHIPDPSSDWAPPTAKFLIKELGWYATKLTSGGRLSYSAPKGLNDDLVISLALANWGKVRGLAGGGLSAADITLSREQWKKDMEYGRQRKPGIFKKMFKRRKSSVGFDQSSGSFWNG